MFICFHFTWKNTSGIAGLLIIAETWKQSKCPSTAECIKMWDIYIMEYHPAIKKNEIRHFQQHGWT